MWTLEFIGDHQTPSFNLIPALTQELDQQIIFFGFNQEETLSSIENNEQTTNQPEPDVRIIINKGEIASLEEACSHRLHQHWCYGPWDSEDGELLIRAIHRTIH